MTEEQRKQVYDLLELAHGYALLGNIMPFRAAAMRHGGMSSEISKLAAKVLLAVETPPREGVKPTLSEKTEALRLALESLETP